MESKSSPTGAALAAAAIMSIIFNSHRVERQLPNEATGLRGLKGWFFGRGEYAHPMLRWLAMPLFRLAWAPFVANVALDYRSTALFILFATLAGVSLAADGLNALLLRRRRRVADTRPQATSHRS